MGASNKIQQARGMELQLVTHRIQGYLWMHVHDNAQHAVGDSARKMLPDRLHGAPSHRLGLLRLLLSLERLWPGRHAKVTSLLHNSSAVLHLRVHV